MARRRARGTRADGKGLHGCVGWVFFGVFFLAGLGTGYFMLFRPLWGIVESSSWEERQCTIVSSHVASHSSSDGTTYSIEVEYTYEVIGIEHRGDRYDWGIGGSSSGYDRKKKVVDALPEGSTQPCYVDPDDPSRSVLVRGPGLFLLWGLFPLPFLLVGLGGLYWLVSRPKVERKAEAVLAGGPGDPGPGEGAGLRNLGGSAEARWRSDGGVDLGRKFSAFQSSGGDLENSSSSTSSFGASPFLAEAQQTDDDIDEVWPKITPEAPAGELVLEPALSRGAKVAGLGCFALFWNAGILAFYFLALREEGDLMSKIFFAPFALVGVGILVAMIHQLLAMRNPVIHLQVDAARLEVGRRAGLRWWCTGDSSRLRSLTIRLRGQEIVKYRRGTSTVTDKHTFYEFDVVQLERVREDRGAAEIALPPTMPSWSVPNHDVDWKLEVKGDIPFWPDISDGFDLEVHVPEDLPRGVTRRARDLPSPTWPAQEPSQALRVRLDRGRYAPGQVVEGEVEWSGMDRYEQVYVSLLWHTEGKGTEASETAGQDIVDAPSSNGKHRFSFRLPDGPWSVDGTLLSVLWMVEASLEPKGDVQRAYLVCAPGGEVIEL